MCAAPGVSKSVWYPVFGFCVGKMWGKIGADMAALTVLEGSERDDKAKLVMRLSMYVYPLEPAFLKSRERVSE